MTDERDAGNVKADDEREARVDRRGLADAVNARMKEIGMKQADLARSSGINVSTLRKIQRASGRDHHGSDLLEKLRRALRLPKKDYLYNIFYRVTEDQAVPTEADVAVEKLWTRLEPYLAKIDALELRLDGRFSDVMDAIHSVDGRIDAVLETRIHPTEDH